MLDKWVDTFSLLIDRLPLGNKWYAWLVCVPLAACWLLADMDAVLLFFGSNAFMWGMTAAAFIWMWWCCRQLPWIWILPYLCMVKLLFFMIV